MLDSVCVPGATLALLLQSAVAAGGRACDGLLLGHLSTTATTHALDSTHAALRLEVTQAHVSSAAACAATHSFYNSTGSLRSDQLEALLSSSSSTGSSSGGRPAAAGASAALAGGSGGLLGWWVHRPGAPAEPSMLDAAVCRHLQAWLAGGAAAAAGSGPSGQDSARRPLLFCVVTSEQDQHSGATLSLRYRCFAYSPPADAGAAGGAGGAADAALPPQQQQQQQLPRGFRPLDVHVLNLGPHRPASAAGSGVGGVAAAASAAAAAAANNAAGTATSSGGSGSINSSAQDAARGGGGERLCALAAALEAPQPAGAAAAAAKEAKQLQKQLLAAGAAATAPGSALALVQGLYDALLRQLGSAAADVSGGDSLAALRRENARLRQQLRAAQQQQGA